MASKSIAKRPNGKWRARYRDLAGKEHARHFARKADAERWLDEVTAALVTGDYIDPKAKKLTVDQWCDLWIESYAKRESTVRQAKVHLAQIREEFGKLPLMAVDEMAVKRRMARLLREGVAQSYRFALHSRLSQVMRAAVRAKKITANPCSRETSPGGGKQRPYVCTDAQLWQLYETAEEKYRPALLLGAFAGLRTAEACGLRTAEACGLRVVDVCTDAQLWQLYETAEEKYRPALLLGAFAGLRTAEACGLRTAEACGLRVVDVDLDARTVTPTVQYPTEPLKTESSMAAVPIPDVFVGELKRLLDGREGEWVLLDDEGAQMGPWKVERHMRRIRKQVPGLSPEFRFHDLRHYCASMLIASGADVKVQQRLRHSKATTTLNTYGHLWPDSDQSTRAAVERAMGPLINNSADPLRTDRGSAEGTASSKPS